MTESTAAGAMLVCDDLRKRYGDRAAVDGVGFHIAPSETYGLLGPNGAGKTTTISMICGLLERDGGSVTVDGRAVDIGTAAAKNAIGYVPQELAIYPELTATENLRFFGQLYGMNGADLKRRIGEVLEIIGLDDRAGERTDQFSGGMKRRLNIGIGLLHQPKLLVLDEPTVGVDPQSRNAILSSVEELGAAGMAVLYTTHYMEEAERLCDRVAIVDHGKVIALGTPRELIASLGAEHVVEFTVAESAETLVVPEVLRALPSVEGVAREGRSWRLTVREVHRAVPALLAALAERRAEPTHLTTHNATLEDVFMSLTGRSLRDG
jgi:ABC-2 type transport system ATP-binding protein